MTRFTIGTTNPNQYRKLPSEPVLSTLVAAKNRCSHGHLLRCIENLITVCPETRYLGYFRKIEGRSPKYLVSKEGVVMLKHCL